MATRLLLKFTLILFFLIKAKKEKRFLFKHKGYSMKEEKAKQLKKMLALS